MESYRYVKYTRFFYFEKPQTMKALEQKYDLLMSITFHSCITRKNWLKNEQGTQKQNNPLFYPGAFILTYLEKNYIGVIYTSAAFHSNITFENQPKN